MSMTRQSGHAKVSFFANIFYYGVMFKTQSYTLIIWDYTLANYICKSVNIYVHLHTQNASMRSVPANRSASANTLRRTSSSGSVNWNVAMRTLLSTIRTTRAAVRAFV